MGAATCASSTCAPCATDGDVVGSAVTADGVAVVVRLNGAADGDVECEAEAVTEARGTTVEVAEREAADVPDKRGRVRDTPNERLTLEREGSGVECVVDGLSGLCENADARDLVTETGGAVVTTMELGGSS